MPNLTDLPNSIGIKTGCPWTEEIEQLPDTMPDSSSWPRISIVTPSYNQGAFLEASIRSIIGQGYPNLEYIIIDGGSSDNTLTIIDKYKDYISYFVSERDDGQYAAINKGFDVSTGEIMAWLNSDDIYMPWTFSIVAELFQKFKDVKWLSSAFPIMMDSQGRAIDCARLACSRESFAWGCHAGYTVSHRKYIQQESTFWHRDLWNEAGAHVDSRLQMAGDFELWTRFMKYSEIHLARTPFAAFRVHSNQKTARGKGEYEKETRPVFERHGFSAPSKLTWFCLTALKSIPFFRRWFQWKSHELVYKPRDGKWVMAYQKFL